MSTDNEKSPYIIIGPTNINGPMYGFDLDHTLVTPKGKNKFPKDKTDWKWKYDWIIPVLLHFVNIVIITNQKVTKKNSMELISGRIKRIDKKMRKAGINPTWLISLSEGWYRKPCTGLFELLENVDLDGSFYVGDAAGRKGDRNCSDRKFARNIGVNFFTPEYLDTGKIEKFKWGYLPQPYDNSNEDSLSLFRKNRSEPIVAIMVGPPASGKGTLAKTFTKPILISRDDLGTEAKCVSMFKQAIKDEKHKATNSYSAIVVDNTNPTVELREKYIKIAKENNLEVYCIIMQTTRDMVMHLSLYREGKTGKHIPMVAFNVFYKRYEEPTMDEGYTEIYEIMPSISEEVCEHVYI